MTWRWHRRNGRGRGISLLVPYRAEEGSRREANWAWLREFYAEHLPEAQIVMGTDDDCDPDNDVPFSKAAAVNDAASRATGDVFVILDADCYIRPGVITDCAEDIREHQRCGHRLWFMPFRRFRRLSEQYSSEILRSSPGHPIVPPEPPRDWMMDNVSEKSGSHGHWFGALIQIMPREAFELVGGMDERFRSWGCEDNAMMWAIDSLYARHRTTNNPVWHLFHPTLGGLSTERYWPGGRPQQNADLFARYTSVLGDPMRMRILLDEQWDVT